MIHKGAETTIHMWKKLSFPLWQEPRPQFEFFGEVNKILDRMVPFTITSNFDGIKQSGERKVWLEWTFNGTINEVTRLRIQAELEAFFGHDASLHFCWDGSSARTTLFEARASGPFIQGM